MLTSTIRPNHRTWPAWLVLVIGIVCTLMYANIVQHRLEEDGIKRFAFASDQLTLKINERLHNYSIILEGCSALFRASDTVLRQDWHDYIENLHLEKNAPGTLGIGFNQLIPKEKLVEHIAQVRAEGFLDYRVRPETPREVYTSVVYIEPFMGKNLNAFGYDTFSEPIRRAAMEKARDTGKATLTHKIALVQEEGGRTQASMIMYVPVYQKNMPTKILEQKRAALIGWASAPYRMDDLMQGILSQWQWEEAIDLKIYDDSNISEASLLFESIPKASTTKQPSAFLQKRTINFNGHEWTLLFDTAYKVSPVQNSHVMTAIIIGLILTLLFSILILAIRNTTANAKRIAEALTRKIQKSETQVKKNEAFLQNLIHAMPDLIWLKDKEGVYLTCNSRFESFFGNKKQHIIGKTDYDFVDKTMADMFRENDFKAMYASTPHTNEEWITFASDGHKELLETTKMPIYDDNHTLLGILGIGHDITKRKEMEEQINQLAFYDSLTHLPNRRLLNDRLQQALLKSARSRLYGALMFIDLDNFKSLNDNHGHLAGDMLLADVAKRLQESIRDIDTIARFGGDEFVIILNDLHENLDTATTLASKIAEKIRLCLAEPYEITLPTPEEQEASTITHQCTASIGIVLFLDHQEKQEDLLKWADHAMYQAKERGNNQIVFFHH